MINAVVLAGGRSKATLDDILSKIVEYPFYHEIYLFGKYKPLIKVGGEIDGIKKRRPVIEYTLHALAESKNIEGITVIGNKEKLERGLDINLKIYSERCRFVQQAGSLRENVFQGYRESGTKGHALFITADAPLSTREGVDSFIEACQKDFENYDCFYPIVSRKFLHQYESFYRTRKYFWVEDDITNNSDDFMEKGMRGFRISNMAIANPEKIRSPEFIDFAYSARKLRNPLNVGKLVGMCWGEIFKYMAGKLKLSEIQEKISRTLGTRLKFVEIEDALSSLDVDAEGDEKSIEKINNYSQTN
ncbi:MAG: nucleotidyltransferase family protein [archaeon]